MDSFSVDPPPCANGCGFFGRPETQNLCSKCYRDHLKQEESAIKAKPKVVVPTEPTSSSDDVTENVVSIPDGVSRSKKRCGACKKKVGVIGYECRCGSMFCGRHRLPESHECTFDFKGSGRAVLATQNPICKADKLQHRI